MTTPLAEQLDGLLEAEGALSEALKYMPEVDMVPRRAEEFLGCEQETVVISSYQNQVVPGLLQTEAYARAVFRSRIPAYDADEVERLVAARIGRQEILRRKEAPITCP
jgi:hypothetical protein